MLASQSDRLTRARLLTGALMATTALAGASAAAAQQAGGSTVSEIVVTAQKREENVQKVPLSIQVLTTAKLEQLQVNNAAAYVKYLPSVSTQTLAPGFAPVYMRGVASGENSNHTGPLPSVGTYLDEMPITTIGGALDVHIYDVARVEALAGPQGTLYGASSESGTIRIITNKPQIGTFSAAYDVSGNKVDHGDWGYSGEGFVNVPISDQAAIRIVGWGEHDAGYIDNVPGTRTYHTSGTTISNAGTTAKNNYNDVDLYGGRAALKIDLNDSWTVTPSIIAQDEKVNGVFAYDPTVGDLQVKHFRPENSHDRWLQAALTIEGQVSNFDIVYAGGYMTRRIDSQSDYSDYTFFYDSAPFYYGAYWYDNSGNPVSDPTQYIQGKDHFAKQSHELRISSPKDNRFRVIAGAFFERQTHNIQQRYLIDGLQDAQEVPGWPDTIWLTKQVRVDRDYAVFGEASFDILDNLTFTAGLRRYKADNSIIGFFGYGAGFSSHTGEAACFAPPAVAGSPCTNLDKEVKETGTTYRFNLTWQATPDKMLYATWSKGFRPGGINRNGALPPYQADYLSNYEAGWKTMWADGRVRFNGAVFWEEWKDFQFSFLGLNGLTEIRNAPHARIKGVEADLTVRPDDHFTLTAGAAYVDAKLVGPYCGISDPVTGATITSCANPNDPANAALPVCATTDANGDPIQPCRAQAPSGQQLPVTPRFKANATARYEFPLGDYNAHLQGSIIGQSGSWADLRSSDPDPSGTEKPVRTALGRQRPYATVDFTTGVERGNWMLELFLLNAFDNRADIYRYAECRADVCGPETYITTNQPRTIGVRFGQKF